MFAEQWSKFITASVIPGVVISASSLFALALYNRLAAIVSRIRAVQRERLQLQEKLDNLSQSEKERGVALSQTSLMASLSDQTFRMRRRARMIRNALLCLMGDIASLVLSSLLSGLTSFCPWFVIPAAITFILGMLCILCCVAFAASELLVALHPAELETDIVSELTDRSI